MGAHEEVRQKRYKKKIRDSKPRSTRQMVSYAKRSAASRGLGWDIDDAEYLILVGHQCVYCNGILGDRGVRLDRLDNDLGYTLANVVPCCYLCNITRGNRFSSDEMKIIGNAIRQVMLMRQ